MIIDTHSHCYWDSLLPRIDEVLENMKKNGVDTAVQIGCDTHTTLQALELAKRFPGVFYATAGIHPETSQDMDYDAIDKMINDLDMLIQENRNLIVGVGECGLDHHYLDKNRIDEQKRSQKYALKVQGKLAQKYRLPVIIHTRDARDETIPYLQDAGITFAVMHCYSEDYALALSLLEYSPDIYFSFSGILTYKKAPLIQEAASKIPLERILIETDAPFLAPQSIRGTVNEPANTRFVLEKLIELRTEGKETIEKTVYENSKRFYSID